MTRVRLFISTDMQMISGVNNINGDKDDVQSLVHALMYQDKVHLVGIASSTSKHQPGANDEKFIRHVIDQYAEDWSKLSARSEHFKTAAELHDITYQGTRSVAGKVGYPESTEASRAIIKEAYEAAAAGEKLYVATWGGMGDVARALHDAPDIASTIRLLSASGPAQEPNAYKYVKKEFGGQGELWWIDAQTTQRGIYAGPDGRLPPMSDWWAEDNAQGHGALGTLFYENTQDVRGKGDNYDGVKMGDSYTVFYLIDQANNDDPTADSWGGEYRKAGDRYWVDRTDQDFDWSGSEGARTTYEHRKEWTSDFAKRFDWLNSDADNDDNGSEDNAAPVAKGDTFSGMQGTSLTGNVLANDQDPDGDTLRATLKWEPDSGKLEFKKDGSFVYVPAEGFYGKDEFAYVVSDGEATSSATVEIRIKPVTTDSGLPNDALLARSGTLDASAPTNQILTGTKAAISVFVDARAASGDDEITNFSSDDVLVLTRELHDSNSDGIISFSKGSLAIDGPKGSDQIRLDDVPALRVLGSSESGLFVYANAAVRPDEAIEGTIGDDRLTGDAKDRTGQTFFFDTALQVDLGFDQIMNFGERDRVVTTTRLYDQDRDGVLNFGDDDGLDFRTADGKESLGHVRISDMDKDALGSVELISSFEQNGATYYVYGMES